MSDGVETKVGYWANFYHVPTVSNDTSGWTEEQRTSFIAELERQNEEMRVRALGVLDALAALDEELRR